MKPTKLIRTVLHAAALSVFAGSSAFAQETMKNSDVISLVKAGLSSSIIIDKIRTSKSDFDLSTDALILLKQAGVPDDIVGAMLSAKTGAVTSTPQNTAAQAAATDPNDPMAPHDYGIYMFEERDGSRKMTQMMPAVSQQNRTGGGFTASITPFGLGKVKTKANLPGTAAKLQLNNVRPVFYFYLDNKTGGLNTASGIPATPSEFALIRFNVRSDNREVTIAKANAYGAKGGLSDEYVVEFNAEDLGNGIFKVTPTKDLKNGEYAFYLLNSGNATAGAAIGAKFFDFGVKLTP
jgi:hypothetical protein